MRKQIRNTVVKVVMNAKAMATDAVVTLLLVAVMSLVTEVMTVVTGMRTWTTYSTVFCVHIHCCASQKNLQFKFTIYAFQTKTKRKKLANFFIFSDPPQF